MTSRPIHGMKLLIVLVGKNTIFLISVLSINNTVNFYSIYRYATVTTTEGAIFIGGASLANVYLYNSSGWTRLDNLHTSREYHRAIINGDKIYVIGLEHCKQRECLNSELFQIFKLHGNMEH